jgi:putative membrane protein
MVGLLTESEHARIREAVARAESITSVEIRLVLARSSSRYDVFTIVYPALAALLAGGLVAAVRPWLEAAMLFAVEAAIFVVLFALLHWPALLHAVVIPAVKRRAAWQQARLHYANIGLTHPHLRSAVLVYCSAAERYVEVLVDDAIAEKLPSSIWAEIVGAFRAAIAEDRVADAFVGAAESCAQILAPVFPAVEGQSNSLPDDLEEL